jgi:hypothetical protein
LEQGGWLDLFGTGALNPDTPTLTPQIPETPAPASTPEPEPQDDHNGAIGHGALNEGSTHDKNGRKIRGSRRGDEFDVFKFEGRYAYVEFTSGANSGDKYWIKRKRIKNYTEYEEGGLADFTGPAWLDGTKAKPEYILNAKDTEKMFNAVEQVASLDSNLVKDILNTLQMTTVAMLSSFGGISAGTVTSNYGEM